MRNGKLELKDIQIGNIDAKNQLLAPGGRDLFLQSFVSPDNFVEEEFLHGRKSYIYGLKGTGKTALIQYLLEKVESQGDRHILILFREELTDDERKRFAQLSNITVLDEKHDIPDEVDYEPAWSWYFHRKISEAAEKHGDIFKSSPDLVKYIEFMKLLYKKTDRSLVSRIIPKVQKGHVTFSADAAFLAGEIGLDLEWIDHEKKRIPFIELVRKADQLIQKLSAGPRKLFILIDEIELSVGSRKKYERDCRIVRDLIIALERTNRFVQRAGLNVQIIAAIRSEILRSPVVFGDEINKRMEDFGHFLFWHRRVDDESQHPLAFIVQKRIEASEAERFGAVKTMNVWDRYFPSTIRDVPIQKYVIDQTFYRPRDLVRLLKICIDQNKDQFAFTQQILEEARKRFSEQTWTELAEELRVNYDKDDIDAIEEAFTGFKPRFTLGDIRERLAEKNNKNVRRLIERHKLEDMLSDLFRIGMVGNDYSEKTPRGVQYIFRWAFRDDPRLIMDKRMAVHRSLWKYFSLA